MATEAAEEMVTVETVVRVKAGVLQRAVEALGRDGLSLEQAVEQMLVQTAQEGTLPLWPEGSMVSMYGEDDPAYDKWFRAQVQEALDDPRPGIPHEEVRRRMEIRRAEALAKVR